MNETVPEPETEVFWSQVNTVSPSNVCVYIWYKANELVQARRLKAPSKSSASAKFTYLIHEQPSNPPPPAATGGRVRELVTMMNINTTCQTTASCALRFREICDIIY